MFATGELRLEDLGEVVECQAGAMVFLRDGGLLLSAADDVLHYFPSGSLRPLVETPSRHPRTFSLAELCHLCPEHLLLRLPPTARLSLPVDRLLVSPSAPFVSVLSKGRAALLVIPQEENYPPSLPGTIDAVVFALGPSTADAFVQAAWHPLSREGSHLCLLSTTGDLHMYNVVRDLTHPEQSVRLSPRPAPGLGTGTTYGAPSFSASLAPAHSSIPLVTAFTIGEGENDPWSAMTVWGVTDEGDVHAACPFLPFRHKVSPLHLEKLRGWVDYKESESGYEAISTPATRAQRSFLDRLSNGLRSEDGHAGVYRPIALQGPFLLQPEPFIPPAASGATLGPEDLHEFAPLAVTYVAKTTPEMPDLLLLSSPRRTDIALVVTMVEPRWIEAREAEGDWQHTSPSPSDIDGPVIAIHETLLLEGDGVHATTPLHPSPSPSSLHDWEVRIRLGDGRPSTCPSSFLIISPTGFYSVDMSPWSSPLPSLLARGECPETGSEVGEHPLIERSALKDHLLDLALLPPSREMGEEANGMGGMALLSGLSLILLPPWMLRGASATSDAPGISPTPVGSFTSPAGASTDPLPPKTPMTYAALELPRPLSLPVPKVSAVHFVKLEGVDTPVEALGEMGSSSLQGIANHINDLRTHIAQVSKAKEALSSRVQLQQVERQRQRHMEERAFSTGRSSANPHAKVQDLRKIILEITDAARSYQQLGESLMAAAQPDREDLEEAFQQEVSRIHQEVQAPGGLQEEHDALVRLIHHTKDALDSVPRDPSHDPSGDAARMVEHLRANLQQRSEAIERLHVMLRSARVLL